MQPLTYFLAALISFTGIIAGAVLAFVTKEEMKPGIKYFMLLQKALLAATAAVFVYYSGLQLPVRIVIYAAVILLLALSRSINSSIAYALLGGVFYFSSFSRQPFLIISALIFLYGLPTGSIIAAGVIRKPKSAAVKKALLTGAWFVAVAALLGLIL
ncbi:hypothetical protein HYV82_00220 [Candidatus Woesearchaeota archaeon]|nr:hypothetical protein [Candidatus Woesearchaeota archaeon]